MFSFLLPGLGQIYAGRLWRGFFWPALVVTLSVAIISTFGYPSPFSWWLGCALVWANWIVELVIIIDACRSALRCGPEFVRRSYNRWYVYVLLVIVMHVGFVAYFFHARDRVIQAFSVPTDSMFPTIVRGDLVAALKSVYRTVGPQRGDIVLFPNPDDARIKFVKRVVAIAGDTIEMKDNELWVNGVKCPHEYIEDFTLKGARADFAGKIFYETNAGIRYRIFLSDNWTLPDVPLQTIPPGQCFVLGDDRNLSLDSRRWGPIPVESVGGRFAYRFGPISAWGRLGYLQ